MDVSRQIVYRASSTWNPVADYRYDGRDMSKDAKGRRGEEEDGCLLICTVYGKLISVRPQVP